MDAVLRQSKAMCPFLKQASPATLRALSTSTRAPAAQLQASPCGGTFSRLQLLGQRCPVMGKALAIQSSRLGKAGMAASATVAGLRHFSALYKSGKAGIHTTRAHDARPVEAPIFAPREDGTFCLLSGYPRGTPTDSVM